MANVESFVFYTSWLEAIKELDGEDQLRAILAIMNYQAYHIEPELEGVSKAIFKMAKPIADSLYNRRQTNTENGKKGGRPRKAQSGEEPEDKADLMGKENPTENPKKPIGFSEKNLNENDNDNENDNENNKKENTKEKANRFLRPTLEEVKAYCRERQNGVNAEKWYDFYESKGWMVGKNHMKDWKAAVRTWEKEKVEEQPKRYVQPW